MDTPLPFKLGCAIRSCTRPAHAEYVGLEGLGAVVRRAVIFDLCAKHGRMYHRVVQ